MQYPRNPEAYEIRLIDDESTGEKYKPYYEVGPLDRRDKIGDSHQSLAFVQVKGFRTVQNNEEEADRELINKLRSENVRISHF